MRILLITPPMTQVNTPYPATAYLTGFLRERGYDAVQADLSIELFLKLFCREGLQDVLKRLQDFGRRIPGSKDLGSRIGAGARASAPRRRPPGTGKGLPASVSSFLAQQERYLAVIDSVVRFLQQKDSVLAHRIVADGFLPRGPRFRAVDEWAQVTGEDEGGLEWAFGQLGLQDRAQYFASLFIDDIADVIRDGIDARFELSRYGEKLAASAPSFDPILKSLNAPPSLVDEYLDLLTRDLIDQHSPDVIGLSVPFPGNVYGAFRVASQVKAVAPRTAILLGGGYVNTELREIADARVFDFVDFITLDDGERPVLSLLAALEKHGEVPQVVRSGSLLRTFVRDGGKVVLKTDPKLHDIPLKDSGTPTYEGLPISRYVSLCEMLNPMHRLWSDGRWNKLTLAHGCYWKKCSFCDTSLDYIGRYEPQAAGLVVDRMEKLIAETGQSGFHFVDEAAPPKLLGAMAQEILRRGLVVSWWGNIRFEKTFTLELAELLAASGCVAMSGGLEVASDRLLKLMEKGVTVEQVARVTRAFTDAGIMVHAYLMYGFPSQTVAETVDALERVRQLFEAGCIQSAFWHRFAATVHSPVGRNPEKYGIELQPVSSTFAKNDVAFVDTTGVDHDALYPALKRALYNYMLGLGLDEDVRSWFDFPVPKARVPKSFVARALRESPIYGGGRSTPLSTGLH